MTTNTRSIRQAKSNLKGADECPKLIFKFEGTQQKIMRNRGVDGMCFVGSRNVFDFDVTAVRIKPDIPNVTVRGISVRKQIQSLSRVIENPLYGHPIVGIGSFPSDLRAKLLAANIMNAAIKFQDNAKSQRMRRYDYPIWHKVYGGFKDDVRDNGLEGRPSMLIMSNVDIDSTAPKVEKVRDILEQNPNIPRIVVVSGCDPMYFFATRLHLPMDFGFYMGPGKKAGDTDSVVLDF